jgi:broad specificity phosphatase PhoE
MMKRTCGWLVLGAMVLAARPASAQQVVFVVRHAERADGGAPASAAPSAPGMMANDPPLSAAGEQRAAKLASTLASAGIRHIFTTEYRRTKQTAAPFAEALKITPTVAPARDSDALIAQVLAAQGGVLIVGHSNTVPELLKKLGVADAVTIGDNDYDNLFIVIRDVSGARLLRLHY